ncbi:MAG: hypothetical protein LBU83_04080 [Bacteroidales bacterium]|jgi:hypothetical protein|nr:hypothetical protein [Bacteroidales bacterium]
MKKISYLLVIISVLLCTCRKIEKYSDIPKIKFISFEKYYDEHTQNGAILTFSFQDGNGDIGLNDSDNYPPFDTSSIYYYNFFCDYYEKQNGKFEKVELPGTLNARIPRLSKLQEESINGEIYLRMPFYYDSFSSYDTIQLKFYIVDRKLNKSNVEEVITTKR